MKNGIEVRGNGSEIHKRVIFGYDVKIMKPSGELQPSKNNPWDFLGNARKDADAGYTGQNRPERSNTMDDELAKDIATEFYYWWHNQSGTNTASGFDDWWAVNKKRFKQPEEEPPRKINGT